MPAQAKQIDHDPCVQTDSQQPMLHQDFQISVMQKEFFLMKVLNSTCQLWLHTANASHTARVFVASTAIGTATKKNIASGPRSLRRRNESSATRASMLIVIPLATAWRKGPRARSA